SRCYGDDHGVPTFPPLACAAADVVSIDIDLASLYGEKLWSAKALDASMPTEIDCDSRFSRPFSGPASYDYTYANFTDVDSTTRLVFINGVPWEQYVGGAAYKAKLQEAMTVSRAHWILDEREGGGGWFEPAFSIFFGSTFAKTDLGRTEMIPA